MMECFLLSSPPLSLPKPPLFSLDESGGHQAHVPIYTSTCLRVYMYVESVYLYVCTCERERERQRERERRESDR